MRTFSVRQERKRFALYKKHSSETGINTRPVISDATMLIIYSHHFRMLSCPA